MVRQLNRPQYSEAFRQFERRRCAEDVQQKSFQAFPNVTKMSLRLRRRTKSLAKSEKKLWAKYRPTNLPKRVQKEAQKSRATETFAARRAADVRLFKKEGMRLHGQVSSTQGKHISGALLIPTVLELTPMWFAPLHPLREDQSLSHTRRTSVIGAYRSWSP